MRKIFTLVLVAASVVTVIAYGPVFWRPLGVVPWQIGAAGAALFLCLSSSTPTFRLLAALALVVGAGRSLHAFGYLGFLTWQQLPRHHVGQLTEWVRDIEMFVQAYAAELFYYRIWAITNLTAGLACLLVLILWRDDLIVIPLSRKRRDGIVNALRSRPGWLGPAEIKRLARNRTGVPLGLYRGQLLRYPTDSGFLGGHHAVIAGTRAGKGVGCVLPAIVDHDGPVVVVDIKGENSAICKRHRASLGREQVVLNPFGLIDGETSGFDPMSYLRRGPNLQRDVAVLADGLITPIPGEAAFISDAARQLVEAALEVTVTIELDGPPSLLSLVDMLLGPSRMDTFLAWTEDTTLCGGRAAQAGTNILGMGDRQRGSVLAHIQDSLEWLKYDQMRSLVAPRGEEPFSALLTGQADLYVVIPQDMTRAMGGFMRVVLNTILGAVTRQDGKSRVAQKILCVMDEFTRLGKMEKVMEIATIAAGGGVEAIFIAQDLGTLESTYGENDARTLLGSCATTRIFGLGSGDDMTPCWAESLMPMYPTYRWTESRNPDGTVNRTKIESEAKLLSAAELLELPAAVMLCRIRANPGLLLDQIVSHHHPAYCKRLDPNPVVRA